MPWIIILAFALHPEKKALGFGFCGCEVKGGTRDILRFPFALGTNGLRFPLYLTTPCYKGPLLCPLHWPKMRSQIMASSPPSALPSQSFPSAHLLRGTFGLLPCPSPASVYRKVLCRNWAGSRK